MAITIINHVAAQSTDTNTITSDAIDTSTADTIILAVADYGLIGASTISDSFTNSYGTLFTQTDVSGVSRLRVMVTDVGATTVGAGHTFTATVTGGFPALAVIAIKGRKSGLPVTDGLANTSIENQLSGQTGNILCGTDNELVVSAVMFNVAGTTATIDSGFTIEDQLTNVLGTAFGIALAYILETTAADKNPTWTFSTQNTVPLGGASFFAAIVASGNYLLVKN